MKKLLLSALLSASVYCMGQDNPRMSQPKLVVGIVIDQMRADYIYKYRNNLTQTGFLRLLNEGFECSNTQYNYVPTYTGPGHASIYTGTTPATHGIIANDWYENGETVYCAGDPSVQAVGSDNPAGQMSPHRLLTTTLADEMMLFTNFRSKVIGISMKDRGAIFPAGHSGQAYWFDNLAGAFVTSSFYKSKAEGLPSWLMKFNSTKPADKYLNGKWETLLDINKYTQSTTDNTPYENILDPDPEALPVFPYDLKKISAANADLLRRTPFGNTVTKEMAMAAIEGESLGADSICDMLFISFSSTDYIGHLFGTNAIETEDAYLRLDRDLSELFSFLDKKVGRNNYLLFLTADHAALQNPLFLKDHHIPGGHFHVDSLLKYVNDFTSSRFNDSMLLLKYMNEQIWLDDERVSKVNGGRAVVESAIAEHLLKLPFVADVMTSEQLTDYHYASGMKSMVQNGFNRKRSGDIALIYKSGYLEVYGKRRPYAGTSHGSPFRYDTQVPLHWMGWNIKKGRTSREVSITDVAATVADLLNICQPSGCSGKPIIEITDLK